MSDKIFIEGLSLHAYHGVMAYEAKVGQTFTIDLELDIDLSEAAKSDKVVDTVSYDKVVDCVSAAFRASRSTVRMRGPRSLGNSYALSLPSATSVPTRCRLIPRNRAAAAWPG